MDLPVISNYPLVQLNTFGIAASAARFMALTDVAQLPALLADQAFCVGPRFILGGGSNVVLTDDFAGTLVQVALKGVSVVEETAECVWIDAAAGEVWHDFVRQTLSMGAYGLENLSLIPGTVGACPIQNIGAYGVEVKDVIDSVLAVRIADGAMRRFACDECGFAYRESVFKQTEKGLWLILSVRFRLSKQARLKLDYGDIQAQLQTMAVAAPTAVDVSDAICAIRQRKLPDPAVLGNAGSFFKNPIVTASELTRLRSLFPDVVHYPMPDGGAKLAAGWLIEQAGLKGARQGAVGVHVNQALVLVNYGGAQGREVLAMAEAVQAAVMARYGVRLEMEPSVLP